MPIAIPVQEIDTFDALKAKEGAISTEDFRRVVLTQFDDILQNEAERLTETQRGILARLRARIEIELKTT